MAASAFDPAFPRGLSGVRAGDRSHLGRQAVMILALLLVLAMLVSLSTGASGTDLSALFHVLGGEPDPQDATALRDHVVMMNIRLPRMILGMLVGAGLAVSGLVMQGLFRNPLADPGLVGVSSGAGLGAVGVIVLGTTALAPLTGPLGIYSLQIAAFLGGLATTTILYRVATRSGQTAVATMLLAGIAIGALAGAATGVLVYVATDSQLRDLTFWNLGSLAGANWTKVMASGPIIALALGATLFLRNGLNALTLGEATAAHMGVPVERLKRVAIIAVAAATGAAVAVSGGIGFVGIVVPHLLRLVIGPDHRYLLPASALLGASFLLLADAVSRTIVAPAELPIGIVTAAVGGPFFLWILLRRRSAIAW
ncbi:iron ABC transporter permease [Arsenicitalea aurantiaca]|uniref:Iron ABC transporter permease n=1 Tax=Arsenicitalea aurantiaca TaxID=1783274 RepID=A0A433X8K9_9HYPH|nr:iron ABC transporter permease [Arsenicitalea aurantiaca]RUT30392.1 iron ABC transporter permease [Arsenicitalea aurantiaca]